MTKHQPFRLLFRNHNFLKLWVSQIFSQLTINIMNFYVLTRIYAATRSTIAVSLIWVAGALPSLIFGPFSGPIVDSFSRRKMMIFTNFFQGLVIALALLITSHRIFPLYVIVFLYWFLDQLYLPSQQASVPWLVEKKLLAAANGLFLLTQQASILVGFGLGGILLSLLGPRLTIILASLNLFIAAVSVYLLPKDTVSQPVSEKSLFRFWQDFQHGYTFLKNHRLVLLPLLLIAVSQIFISITAVVLPTYTFEVLGLDINHAGIVLVVPGALGALLVTYFLPKLLSDRRKKDVVASGLLVGGLSLVGLGLISFLPFLKVLAAVLIAVGLGAAIAAIIAPSQSLIQHHTPALFRGRVYAQMSFLMIVATTLPLIASASVADVIGVAAMISLMGVLLIIGYLFIRHQADHVLANGFGI